MEIVVLNMVSEQLIEWIKSAKTKGFSDDQLKQKMLSQGYRLQDIQDAILGARPPVQSPSKSSYSDYDPEKEKKPIKRVHHINIKLYAKSISMVLLFIAAGFFLYTTLGDSSLACETNLECGDGDDLTFDMCLFPGLESSSCINAPKKTVDSSLQNTFSLSIDEYISFDVAGSIYVLSVNKIGAESGLIFTYSPKKILMVRSGNFYDVDMDGDGIFDFQLNNIVMGEDKMTIEIVI